MKNHAKLNGLLGAILFFAQAAGSAGGFAAHKMAEEARRADIWQKTGLIMDIRKIIADYLDGWKQVRNFENHQELVLSPEFGNFFANSVQMLRIKPLKQDAIKYYEERFFDNYLASSPSGVYVAGSMDHSLVIVQNNPLDTICWAVQFKKAVNAVLRIKNKIFEQCLSVRFSPNDQELAVAVRVTDKLMYLKNEPVQANQNYAIILFNIKTGKARCFEIDALKAESFMFSPDGSALISQYKSREIRIWDLKSSKLLSTFVSDDINGKYDNTEAFIENACAFCPEKFAVIGTGASFVVMNLLRKKNQHIQAGVNHIRQIECAASESGSYIALSGNNGVEVWQNEGPILVFEKSDEELAIEKKNNEQAEKEPKKKIIEIVAHEQAKKQENKLLKEYYYLTQLPQITNLGKTPLEAWCSARSDFEKQMQLVHFCVEIGKINESDLLFVYLVELEHLILNHAKILDASIKALIVGRINQLRKKVGQPANFEW